MIMTRTGVNHNILQRQENVSSVISVLRLVGTKQDYFLQELLQYLKILLDVDHITERVHVGMVVRIVSRHAGHRVKIFSQTQLREGEGGEVFTVVSRVSLLLLRNQIYAMK